MLGFLRGVFGGAQEPPSELAARLADYVEAMVAVGGLRKHVDDYLSDPDGFEPPAETTAESLAELPLEAQMYPSCFIVQAIMESGSSDAKKASAVFDYVLRTAGRCNGEQAQVIGALGRRLRRIIAEDPAADEDWERELRAYGSVGEAAVADAQAYMARADSDDGKPTPAEIARFLTTYVKEDERAAEGQSLAEYLSRYAQELAVAATLKPNVETALSEPEGFKPEKLAGKGYLGWTAEAQVFLISLVLEVCISRGFSQDKEIFSVVRWVFEEGLRHPEANAPGIAATVAQLRQLALAGDGVEDQSEEVQRLVPVTAHGIETGKAVAAPFAAGDGEVPDAEIDDIIERFGDED